MNKNLLLLFILLLPFYSYSQSKHSLNISVGPALLNDYEGVCSQLEVGHRYQTNNSLSIQHSIGYYAKVYAGKYISHKPTNAYGLNYSAKGNMLISSSDQFRLEASAGLTAVYYTDFRPRTTSFIPAPNTNGNQEAIIAYMIEEEILTKNYDLSPILGLNLFFQTGEKSHLIITAEQAFPGFWNDFTISKLMVSFGRSF